MFELSESPPEGIKVYINEDNLTDIQATLEGPGIHVEVAMVLELGRAALEYLYADTNPVVLIKG